MFHVVGDYVRNGDTVKDPVHSTVVAVRDDTVFSMNRCSGQLFLHVWNMEKDTGLLDPLGSVLHARIREDFLSDEKVRTDAATGKVRE